MLRPTSHENQYEQERQGDSERDTRRGIVSSKGRHHHEKQIHVHLDYKKRQKEKGAPHVYTEGARDEKQHRAFTVTSVAVVVPIVIASGFIIETVPAALPC